MNVVMTALDGLALRQQVIARNLAHRDTPGHVALQVDFEQALRGAQGADRGDGVVRIRKAGPGEGGLNRQVALLGDTVLRYQALLKGVNRQLAMLQLAISDGRR